MSISWRAWQIALNGDISVYPALPREKQATGDICFSLLLNYKRCHRKGLVTDVSGAQRNACPGTLTPEEGLKMF
jgi:hypothetical protein